VGLYRDQGVVLRTYRLGEADRIIVLLTEGRGKVRAVAKGVRKTKSRFGSRLEPVSHLSALFYEGRGELDIVSQAETLDHFKAIREDLDRLSRASSMLEAVDQLAQEREANPRLYQMLVNGLRSLAANNAPLTVGAFYWKLLALEGFRPLLDQCAVCGSTDDLVAFDLGEGGVLCRTDRRGAPVSLEALDLMRRVLGGELNRALAEPDGPVVQEVDALATQAMEHHIERRLRSVHILDRG
jgi:DNA repair protein RecO (recombination protein O)